MAVSYGLLERFKEAMNFEKQSWTILSRVLNKEDPRIEESKTLLHHYTNQAVLQAKFQIQQEKNVW